MVTQQPPPMVTQQPPGNTQRHLQGYMKEPTQPNPIPNPTHHAFDNHRYNPICHSHTTSRQSYPNVPTVQIRNVTNVKQHHRQHV